MTEKQKTKLAAYQRSAAPKMIDERRRIAQAKKPKTDFEASLPHCLVSVAEEEPHVVRILPRGNFLDESGPIVQPALPGYLTSLAPRVITSDSNQGRARLSSARRVEHQLPTGALRSGAPSPA